MNGRKADLSFDERRTLVTDALRKQAGGSDLWIVELYDDRAIYEVYADNQPSALWQVPYTLDANGTVALGDRVQVQRQVTYNRVKFVKGAPNLIEGLAIPFGGPIAGKDFDGERFTSDTDLCLPWFGETGRPALYGHGLNAATKAEVVGRQVSLELKPDVGYWIQAELDKRSRYADAIGKLVDEGALSFSSGAMPHLVQTKSDGTITRWPWVEISLTPTPANPLAAVYAVKSLDAIEHLAAAQIEIPAPLAAALNALDEWAATKDAGLPDGLTYADESARLLDALKTFVERTQQLAELRAKEGRALSNANRQRLAAHVETIGSAMDSMRSALQSMRTTHADMTALLQGADPEAAKRAAEAELARFEYLSTSLPK